MAANKAPAKEDGELVQVSVWVRRYPGRTMFLRQTIAEGQFQDVDGPSFEVTLNLSGGGGYLCRIGDYPGEWFLLGPGEFASGVRDLVDPLRP